MTARLARAAVQARRLAAHMWAIRPSLGEVSFLATLVFAAAVIFHWNPLVCAGIAAVVGLAAHTLIAVRELRATDRVRPAHEGAEPEVTPDG